MDIIQGLAQQKDLRTTQLGMRLMQIISRNNPSDVILVDDARLFGRRSSYPALAEISKKLKVTFANSSLMRHDDIACFLLGQL